MNGTESAMFNRLEDIALSPEPETPFLSCKISRALEPAFVGDHVSYSTNVQTKKPIKMNSIKSLQKSYNVFVIYTCLDLCFKILCSKKCRLTII